MPTSEPIAAGNPPVPHVVIVDPAKYDSCVSSKAPVEPSLDRSLEEVPSKGEGFEQDGDRRQEIDSCSSPKRSPRTNLADLTSIRIPTYHPFSNVN